MGSVANISMNRAGQSSVDNTGAKARTGPVIRTSFSGYEPPFDPVPLVRRMLESVPEKYLAGLGEVVLTNVSGLARERRRSVSKSRGRKTRLMEARGAYHPAFKGTRAWIEIFVDNSLHGWEQGWWRRIPLLRENKIGEVLFHEIGHHIHFTCQPEFREREDVADVWKVRLQNHYSKNRYRWMAWFSRLARPLLDPFVQHLRAKVEGWMLRNGQISRAEYDESMRTRKSGKASFPG